ncbi:hypothetical protein GLP43_09065 [Sulfitobacter sp. M39]|uniref:hypothetical protein n=1 Tax=Sulfitobacter sp. M39 TaxID=2675334 RepID=UPI001F20DAE6|nr:hypothetical protein [Sulfitobacter sp. M39]MCF7747714.1 hypothetical protein [Sulfitobacter sp. M39]
MMNSKGQGITHHEFLFAVGGEIVIEADLWEFMQLKPEDRPNWPDVHILAYLDILFRIDQHAIAGTLDEFRNALRIRGEFVLTDEETQRKMRIEGPWIREWVNLYRVLNGPDNVTKRKVSGVAERFLGLEKPHQSGTISMTAFGKHPRTEMELLETLPRHKKPRGGGNKLAVPWGSETWIQPMNQMRLLVLRDELSRNTAAKQVAGISEKARHSDYYNDILQRFREKMRIRKWGVKAIEDILSRSS